MLAPSWGGGIQGRVIGYVRYPQVDGGIGKHEVENLGGDVCGECLTVCVSWQVIMVVGVVVPIGWFMVKNKHSVQSAWTNMGNKRPH